MKLIDAGYYLQIILIGLNILDVISILTGFFTFSITFLVIQFAFTNQIIYFILTSVLYFIPILLVVYYFLAKQQLYKISAGKVINYLVVLALSVIMSLVLNYYTLFVGGFVSITVINILSVGSFVIILARIILGFTLPGEIGNLRKTIRIYEVFVLLMFVFNATVLPLIFLNLSIVTLSIFFFFVNVITRSLTLYLIYGLRNFSVEYEQLMGI